MKTDQHQYCVHSMTNRGPEWVTDSGTWKDHTCDDSADVRNPVCHAMTKQTESTMNTSKVTGHHQGPKRIICHCEVWYRALSLCYASIQSSGIILTLRLALCQILFLSPPLLLS